MDKNRAFVITNTVTLYHPLRKTLLQNRAKIFRVFVHPRFRDHARPNREIVFTAVRDCTQASFGMEYEYWSEYSLQPITASGWGREGR